MTDGDVILEEIVRRIRAGELRRVVGIVEEGEGEPFIGVFLRCDGGRLFSVSESHIYEHVEWTGAALVGENENAAPEYPSRCFTAPSIPEWLAHPWSKRPAPGVVANIIQEITRVCV